MLTSTYGDAARDRAANVLALLPTLADLTLAQIHADTGITGDVRAGSGPGTSVEAGFGDLVENLEGGLMLAGEAWLGREWGVLADVTWMDLSAEGSGPVGNVTVRGVRSAFGAVTARCTR